MRHKARLALSEFDQLLTSFTDCYESELRPWCGTSATSPAVHSTFGPTLKRVHAPLDQHVNVRVCFSYLYHGCTGYPVPVGRISGHFLSSGFVKNIDWRWIVQPDNLQVTRVIHIDYYKL